LAANEFLAANRGNWDERVPIHRRDRTGFYAVDRPLVFDTPQTYSGDPTLLAASRTYEWIHSVSRLVNALRGAGLALEFLNEHIGLPWPPFPMCGRGEDGLWRLPERVPGLPLSLSLRARKPRA
jgi:hypothetical protein